MSARFWSFCAAWTIFIAAAPWEKQSYAHSWIDAFWIGAGVFCALSAIVEAVRSKEKDHG